MIRFAPLWVYLLTVAYLDMWLAPGWWRLTVLVPILAAYALSRLPSEPARLPGPHAASYETAGPGAAPSEAAEPGPAHPLINLGCPRCGGDPDVCAEVGHDWVTCPGCGEGIRPSYRNCPNCWEPL